MMEQETIESLWLWMTRKPKTEEEDRCRIMSRKTTAACITKPGAREGPLCSSMA